MRVMIADDHLIMREGLRALLESHEGIEVIGEATNGQEAIDQVAALKPDIVLLDISMPVMNGLEATRAIKKASPEVKILILTMHEGEAYFFNILEAGASGYFIKGGSASDLVTALQVVDNGNVFLYPSMAKKLLVDYLQRADAGIDRENLNGLTPREQEVLKLVAEGYNNQEIGTQLSLSPATVQTHRSNIMGKLNLHRRTELTKYAIKHGLISLDE
jgi:DNA-binding NarL/FixJ family response regulator